jgi:hypothetical protein
MSSHGAHERAVVPHRRLRWVLAAAVLVLAAGLTAHALAGSGSGTASATAQPLTSQHRPASASAALAPNGTFITPSGTTATIASLRGRPTMVWFVAGGCASCAASIPAVASHLDQLTGAGLRVLTLGLYGDFPAGKAGVAQLLSFGREAAFGKPITRPGWVWGMASKSLSLAYDPAGIPDLYVLIGATGHIRYRNSVPDSTMGALIAAAKRLDTHAQTTAAVQPCC